MKNQKSVILGLLLIGIGTILLLDNFHIIPSLSYYIFHWSNIFLVLALVNLFSGNYRGMVVLFGMWVFFTLHFFWDWHFRDYWPLIIIVVGLSIIFKNKVKHLGEMDNDDFFDNVNIFSGGKKVYTSQKLSSGKVTSIFGGAEIDLRQARPAEEMTIEIFTLFGGCNLLVPSNWNISMSTTAIFGGFEDKRDLSFSQNGPTVYVRGITIFGGGDLRSSR